MSTYQQNDESVSPFEFMSIISSLISKGLASIDENDEDFIIDFDPSTGLTDYNVCVKKLNKSQGIKRAALTLYDSNIEIYSIDSCTKLYHIIQSKTQFQSW